MNEFLTANRSCATKYFWTKTLTEVYSPHICASFGTFCAQIDQLFEALWVDKSLSSNEKKGSLAVKNTCFHIRIKCWLMQFHALLHMFQFHNATLLYRKISSYFHNWSENCLIKAAQQDFMAYYIWKYPWLRLFCREV